jgi:hypothetical protein
MRLHAIRRRTYLTFSILVCTAPMAWVFLRYFLGVETGGYDEDIFYAGLGTFAACLLTYPAGVLGTIASFGMSASGFLTPTECVLLATPVYVCVGYLQWYVLLPQYFRQASS